MRIRIDLHIGLDAERWADEAGADPGDAARDACWYISDARDCIPHFGEDGCPAFLRALPGWTEEQDILGAVEIRTLWRAECPAADWIAWREHPGPYISGHTVPPGKAREDLARIAVEGLVGMSLLADAHAVMTLTRPWEQVYDNHWRTHPERRRRVPC
ncbi:hypothetical protein [Kitasatospora sp. NPDC058478]|uniref:hypothetical protein n=1 Tax=unclassified Kitasatospora TaxID=2633591 RepID=UPI0036580AC6